MIDNFYTGMFSCLPRLWPVSGSPHRRGTEVRMSIDDHLEFRLLKYFVAVVEAGTFTAAAARLHVAQSAVSKTIRALEDILNVTLFDREHGNTLTAEGRLMFRYAKSSLKTRTRFIQTLQAI